MDICKECGANRYTVVGAQAPATDCLVLPGHGLAVDGELLSEAESLGLSDPSAADVIQCPVTHYGKGGSVASTCTGCPIYSTASYPGATQEPECNSKH
jgi:hypothetical protein